MVNLTIAQLNEIIKNSKDFALRCNAVCELIRRQKLYSEAALKSN